MLCYWPCLDNQSKEVHIITFGQHKPVCCFKLMSLGVVRRTMPNLGQTRYLLLLLFSSRFCWAWYSSRFVLHRLCILSNLTFLSLWYDNWLRNVLHCYMSFLNFTFDHLNHFCLKLFNIDLVRLCLFDNVLLYNLDDSVLKFIHVDVGLTLLLQSFLYWAYLLTCFVYIEQHLLLLLSNRLLKPLEQLHILFIIRLLISQKTFLLDVLVQYFLVCTWDTPFHLLHLLGDHVEWGLKLRLHKFDVLLHHLGHVDLVCFFLLKGMLHRLAIVVLDWRWLNSLIRSSLSCLRWYWLNWLG